MPIFSSPDDIRSRTEVAPHALRREFRLEEFGVDGESGSPGPIGQDRAVASLDFALTMHAHAVLVGPVGTGKTTYALKASRERAHAEPTPPDRCFVPDLERSRVRHLIEVGPGLGRDFARALIRLVTEGSTQVRAALDSDSYQHRRQLLVHQYQDGQQQAWAEAVAEGARRGLAVEMAPAGPVVTVPLAPNGQPYTAQEFMALPQAERTAVQDRQREFEEPLGHFIRRVRTLQRDEARALAADVKQMAEETLKPVLDAVCAPFSDSAGAFAYLSAVAADMAQHVKDLAAEPASGASPDLLLAERYTVDVLVEHAAGSGAPVLLEPNPTVRNLFGRIEFRPGADGPTAVPDLHAGSLARAHGGYLIIPLVDLLQNAMAYAALKRALKLGLLRIEGPEIPYFGPVVPVIPDPLPVSVTVLLVGTPDLYALLWANDADFRRLFPIKVEFEADMPVTPATLAAFRRFVEEAARREAGRALAEGGLETLAGFSAALAEDQERLSTRLGEIMALLREAAVFAGPPSEEPLTGAHIRAALAARRERGRGAADTVARLLNDGTLLLDTDGATVGQINGLAVLSTGDQLFGRPTRITAVTHIGRTGVANIERDTNQSGVSHTKGVLTLAAFFAARFAQRHPLALGASLAFEQLYGGIDGDSASSAELYALLSALADLPIDQGIAVTGSVNQKGEIQPIGGVNEKVDGFYRLCAAQRLTGRQGVLIPRRNLRHLMLEDDVCRAIASGQFHVWAIDHVDEGIALLTGMPAGTADDGLDTVMGRVAARLGAYYESARAVRDGTLLM